MAEHQPKCLYHFTCAHGRKDIGSSNCLLLPHLHPWLGSKVLWLTSEAKPDRQRTGLTMNLQTCDRMAFRYVVSDPSLCRAWLKSYERGLLKPNLLADLEEHGDPEHWWISSIPLRARLDREWKAPSDRELDCA